MLSRGWEWKDEYNKSREVGDIGFQLWNEEVMGIKGRKYTQQYRNSDVL